MVRHIIIWQLKDGMSDAEKRERKLEIKRGLEGLRGRIDGLADIKVYTDLLGSSDGDLMLYAVFTDEAALDAYRENPDHVNVAQNIVRLYTKSRVCADVKD